MNKLAVFYDLCLRTMQRYPRQVMFFVGVTLIGFGGGAFALASIAPDASDLPVRNVREVAQPLPLAAQAELLDLHNIVLFRTDLTRANDSAESLLKRLGIDDQQAAAFLRSDGLVRAGVLGRAGRQVTVEATENQKLQKLTVRWAADDETSFARLTVERAGSAFRARTDSGKLLASTRLGSGVVRTSLFAATDEARIPESVALQLAETFSGDIDFHRALRKGDRFSAVYETLEADGEPLRSGRLLSAEMVNNGRTYQAIWFQEPGAGKGAYYTPLGESMRRAYLASPLEFSRVSSGFKMRFHPILQTWRAHLGVDYAAPSGTSVRTVADGVVDFAGVQNGFGNVVIVQHRNTHSTVYAHLSRIQVRKGQSVSQGQNVGAVGSTGWATGPHLHFEFRVNGHHQDPMTLARQSDAVPVSQVGRLAFDKLAGVARKELLAAGSMQQTGMQ
ncbi:MAG: hypothetical protein RLZZ401_729 [Pseudomonadota bacterium]